MQALKNEMYQRFQGQKELLGNDVDEAKYQLSGPRCSQVSSQFDQDRQPRHSYQNGAAVSELRLEQNDT